MLTSRGKAHADDLVQLPDAQVGSRWHPLKRGLRWLWVRRLWQKLCGLCLQVHNTPLWKTLESGLDGALFFAKTRSEWGHHQRIESHGRWRKKIASKASDPNKNRAIKLHSTNELVNNDGEKKCHKNTQPQSFAQGSLNRRVNNSHYEIERDAIGETNVGANSNSRLGSIVLKFLNSATHWRTYTNAFQLFKFSATTEYKSF